MFQNLQGRSFHILAGLVENFQICNLNFTFLFLYILNDNINLPKVKFLLQSKIFEEEKDFSVWSFYLQMAYNKTLPGRSLDEKR